MTETMAELAGVLAEVATALLLVLFLVRYVCEAEALAIPGGKWLLKSRPGRLRSGKSKLKDIAGCVLPAFLVSRAVFVLTGLVAYAIEGRAGEYGARLLESFTFWDASHYLGLAEDWYVTEGDAMYRIVFYPLYPLLCSLLVKTGIPAVAGAMVLSNAALLLAGGLLHEIARMDGGEKNAARCVWLMFLSPAMFFSSLPFTEGLFLCLCLACVYAARRRRFALAVLLGALAALTRSLGLVTAVPVFWEMLRARREASGRFRVADVLLSVACVLPVALGFAVYVWLNYHVTGDAFRFLTYQKEHWGQSFGTIRNTLRMDISFAVNNTYGDGYTAFIFIPQVISVILAIALMFAGRRALRAGDAAFCLVYFVMATVPTWLLSGVRYMAVCYPLYLILGALTRRKSAYRAALALETAGLVYMSYGYIVLKAVM